MLVDRAICRGIGSAARGRVQQGPGRWDDPGSCRRCVRSCRLGRTAWGARRGVVSVGCALLEDFEDHFIDDVMVADIGEGTDGWEFSGSSYSVVLR